MEAITVFTADAEQGRILKAFLNALSMPYTPAPANKLAQLEAQLTAKQLAWWLELKANIKAINRGEDTGGMDAFEFLNEIERENLTTA